VESKARNRAGKAGGGAATQQPLPRSVLVGLVGKGIQLSRSPAMHEAEGRRLGIDYVYRLLDTEQMGPNPPPLSEIVNAAAQQGYSGLNVTHPYKQEILQHLDRLSDNARAVGSVNTVVLKNGGRAGHNTDLWGFREAFRQELGDVRRDKVLLLGAGGAGAAVAYALIDCDVGVVAIHDPDAARAGALVGRLTSRFGDGRAIVAGSIESAAAEADGIVNASPVGMAGQPGLPIPADLLHPSSWVADIIYFPIETQLLRTARQRGCRTMNGEGMAVFQAVRAFEHFAGVAPSAETMRAAFAARTTPPAA
jgi:quinate/shikimate dehydrogenase (NAD+)